MRRVTLAELKVMGEEARGSIDKIYTHWGASRYNQFFEDYHINIDGEGNVYVSTEDLTERKSHTYKRNSRAIGVTLACCYNGTSNDLGEYPPTEAQIESISQVIGVLARALSIPISINYVMTHGEAGDNMDGVYAHEPYGMNTTSERWDLSILKNGDEWGSGGDILRGKANYYLESGQLP